MEKTMAPELDTVHHIWLPVGPFAAETLGAKPAKVALPAGELACLASWQPYPQSLWSYTAVDLPPALAPGLNVASLEEFLPSTMVRWLLAFGVPAQMVKDILSMRILHAHGGLFADLDVFWLGRLVPQLFGFTLGDEPHGQPAGAVKGRLWNAVYLGLLRMPKGHPLPMELAEAFQDYWTRVALRAVAEGLPPEELNGTTRKDWMHNTKLLSSRVASWPRLAGCVQLPLTLLPLPRRLTLRQFQALAEKADEPAASLGERVDITAPYSLPSLALMEQQSCTANLWTRHWPEPLGQAVLAWCQATRTANLARARGHGQAAESALPVPVPLPLQRQASRSRTGAAASSSACAEKDGSSTVGSLGASDCPSSVGASAASAAHDPAHAPAHAPVLERAQLQELVGQLLRSSLPELSAGLGEAAAYIVLGHALLLWEQLATRALMARYTLYEPQAWAAAILYWSYSLHGFYPVEPAPVSGAPAPACASPAPASARASALGSSSTAAEMRSALLRFHGASPEAVREINCLLVRSSFDEAAAALE